MGTWGRQVLSNTGLGIEVSADGNPEWKAGGLTVDWATVAALAADATLDDLTPLKSGQKYLRYGQVLTRIGVKEVQTITIDATGGTFTISYGGSTTPALAWNASANAVEQALISLASLEIGDVAVTLAGLVYTLTFRNGLGNVAQVTTDATALTGGGGTAAVATTTAGSGTGKFGPYDPAANDGRQTLARGNVFILNRTVVNGGTIPGLGESQATDHPGVLEGGKVYKERVLATAGVASLALGPTFAALETAMPRLSYADML